MGMWSEDVKKAEIIHEPKAELNAQLCLDMA
jgi:hypothetical protein